MPVKRLLLYICLFSAAHLFAADSLTCSGSYTPTGLKEGVWLCRKGDRIYRKERYRNGQLITYIAYNEKGQIVETRNRKGKVKTYNPCGC